MENNINKTEIQALTEKVLHNKKGIGLEANYIENEYETRIETYNKMLKEVESKLMVDEELIVGKINVPHSGGSGGMSVVLYYQRLFFTNKRIFIFDMNFKYANIDEMKIKNVEDIISVKEIVDFDGVNIAFADTSDVFLRGYSLDEKTLVNLIKRHFNK
ncbi:MAG: hypothetical protein ACRC6T_13590 [Sarcina sp.]